MRFQFDPAKATINLQKHSVSFADAEGVFEDPLAIHCPDPYAQDEERFIALGLGSAGELLVVGLHVARGRYSPDLGAACYTTRGGTI